MAVDRLTDVGPAPGEDSTQPWNRSDVRIETFTLTAPAPGSLRSLLSTWQELHIPPLPTVLPVLDLVIDGTHGLVVSPLAPGVSFYEAARDRTVLATLLLSAAVTLSQLHSQGITHGALSPHVLSVSEQGVLFTATGVTRVLHQHDLTPVGMPHRLYRAPELGPAQRATPQSDLYSLGVIAYLALIGGTPVSESDLVVIETLHYWIRALVPPSEIAPDVSAAWDPIILRLIQPALSNRFGSAGDLMRALHPLAG